MHLWVSHPTRGDSPMRSAHTPARITCTRKTCFRSAGSGKIRRPLRRRLQPPLRPRRRDPDQGQPHCRRRRRSGRNPRRRGLCRPPRSHRGRGGHSRTVSVSRWDAGPDVILLDNMPPQTLREAVKMTAGRRGSGGVWKRDAGDGRGDRRDRCRLISTSKITMAAPTLDIGLDIDITT